MFKTLFNKIGWAILAVIAVIVCESRSNNPSLKRPICSGAPE